MATTLAEVNEKQVILAQHLGETKVLIKAGEECGELCQALLKKVYESLGGVTSKRTDELRADIVEEMADVLACIENVKFVMNITDDELLQVRRFKLNRGFKRYNIEEEV